MNRMVWGWAPTFLILCSCSHETQYEKPLTPVTLYSVEEYAGEVRSTYSGSVEPLTRVDVAFRSGGYVDQILSRDGKQPIQEGDFVKKGAVLARLRTKDYDVKVSQAKWQVEQAQAGLVQAQSGVLASEVGRNKAQADLDRASRLLKAESLTKVDFDGAKAGYDSAEQNVSAAKAQVEMAKARIEGARAMMTEAEYALGDSAITAPMSGVVFRRAIEPGALVGPGTPAFTIADTSSVKIIFGAPDMLVGKLKIGQRMDVTTEVYPDVRFPARISRISPAADVKSRVFDVELTIPNQGGRLKAGMTASIEVNGTKAPHPLPVVPLTAVVRASVDSGAYSVFIARNQGEKTSVQRRDIKLGDAFGNRIAVTDGLAVGDKVVVTGATLVRDGDTVRVVPQLTQQ